MSVYKRSSEWDPIFNELLDLIKFVLKNGFVSLEVKNENDVIHEILKIGVDLVKNGYVINYIDLVMEFEISKVMYERNDLSQKDIMTLFIIRKFVPIFQEMKFKEFIELSNEFCSNELRMEIYKLEKYLNI